MECINHCADPRLVCDAFAKVIKLSSPRKELAMSFRTIILIAASLIIGVACAATGSSDALARDHQMNHLTHKGSHHHTVNHGRSVHPGSTARAAPSASR